MSRELSIPHEFICPITREIMFDPVIAADGNTYEQAAIAKWFALGHVMSPITGDKMDNTTLISNLSLKKMIKDQFREGEANGKPNVDSMLISLMDRIKCIELQIGQKSSGSVSGFSISSDNEAAAAAASFAAMKKPSAPPISLFDNESRVQDEEKLKELLQYVVNGRQQKAKNIIKKNPRILQQKGDVTDPSGREFEEITAFQYALWALDWHMWTMMLEFMDNESVNCQIKEQESITEESGYGKHFSFDGIIAALKSYIEKFDNKLTATSIWKGEVGYQQRHFPAHVVNEYCRPDIAFSPGNKGLRSFEESTLPRKLKHSCWNGNWWEAKYNGEATRELSNDEHLKTGFKLGENRQGKGWAIHRGWAENGPGPWEQGLPIGCITKATAQVDLQAMERLKATRLNQYEVLKVTFSHSDRVHPRV